MKIEIIKKDITKLNVEAIVNPANSHITMGGGLARKILEAGGNEIKEEAQKHIPIKVGEAIVTKAGKLPCKFIIHSPTMERPNQKISKENVEKATQAILNCAEQNNMSEIAVPGLGTGVGSVSYEEAAETIIKTIKNFQTNKIKKIVLVAYNENLYQAFKEELS